ncbi:hypothetical protein TNCT_200361, partial [Trichonephila clavata]
NCDDENKAI